MTDDTREHCMHVLSNLQMTRRCCHCGAEQIRKIVPVPGHGPYVRVSDYRWYPPYAHRPCPGPTAESDLFVEPRNADVSA